MSKPDRIPPNTLPPIFQNEQRRMNVQRALGTKGYSPEEAQAAYERELAKEVFDPEVSDVEYFLKRCRHHKIK